jgi:hypothetical protein
MNAHLPGQLAPGVERLFDDLLVNRLARLIWSLRGSPWWVSRVALALAFLILSLAGWRLAGEPPVTLGVNLWAASLLLAALLIYCVLGYHVVRQVETFIAPEVPPEIEADIGGRQRSSALLRWQAALSGGVGALTVLLLAPVLWTVTQRPTPATWAAVFLGSALTVNLIYIPASVSVLSLWLSRDERLRLFPLDPGRSGIVQGLMAVGRAIVRATALLATVGVVGPFLIPGIGAASLVLALLVFTGAVSATGLQYVIQRYAIHRMVARQRRRTESELQTELTRLYERRLELSEVEAGRLSELLAIYAQVAAAEDRVFTVGKALDFASPLLLPMIGLLLGGANAGPGDANLLELLLRLVALVWG